MDQNLVKSAARAIEILELFAAERRPMTAAQIGAALGYPKSSLSVLLKSLVTQGYLAARGLELDYFPTLKLTRLGDWVPASLMGNEALLAMLEELRDRTGETVTLTMAADLHMRCLRARIGKHPISLQVEEGVSFPLIGTAIGTMYLATQPDALVKSRIERWAAQHPGQSQETSGVEAAVAEARARGYACAYDIVLPDTGAVAMPVVAQEDGEPMIVAVAGLNHRIRDKEGAIIRTMRKLTGAINVRR